MKRSMSILLILCSILAIAGCKSKDSGIQFPFPTATQTLSSQPSLMPTQTPTPTQTAVLPTITPTATPTKTPVKTPNGIVYTCKNLGIEFTLPNSWKGWYTVKEKSGSISFYFKPSKPYEEFYDCFLFVIEKKTADNEDDKQFMDGFKEVTIKGVTFYCGGPTDMTYDGPELDRFTKMNGDVQGIYKTIRAL